MKKPIPGWRAFGLCEEAAAILKSACAARYLDDEITEDGERLFTEARDRLVKTISLIDEATAEMGHPVRYEHRIN